MQSGTAPRRRFLRLAAIAASAANGLPGPAACGGAAGVNTAASAASSAVSAAATNTAAASAVSSAVSSAVAAVSSAVSSATSSAAPATSAAAATSASTTSSAAASPTAAPTTAPVVQGTPTLLYQTWWQEMMDNLKPIFPQFEQQYKAKLDIQVLDYNGWVDKLPVEFAGGSPPDTMNANNFGHVKLWDQGVFLDLTGRLKADKIDLAKDYGLMGLEFWCGKNLCMPFDNDPRQVYYNKTLLKEAGAKDPWDDLNGQWTLDDMVNIAMQATKRGADGKATQWGLQMGYTAMSESNGMFVWTFGGKWADFDKMQYTLDSPESIAAHNYVLDVVNNKRCVLTDAESADLTKAGVKDPFREGKTAIYVRASANVQQNIIQMKGKYEWDVAPFPSQSKDKLGVPIVSGNPNEAAAAGKQVDLAYNFIKWLAGPDVQKYFAQSKAEVPSLNAMKPMYASTPPPAHVSIFPDTYKHPYGIHFRHYRSLDAYSEYAKEISQVFLGKASMETTLRSMNKLLNDSYVQYGQCNPYGGMQVPIQP